MKPFEKLGTLAVEAGDILEKKFKKYNIQYKRDKSHFKISISDKKIHIWVEHIELLTHNQTFPVIKKRLVYADKYENILYGGFYFDKLYTIEMNKIKDLNDGSGNFSGLNSYQVSAELWTDFFENIKQKIADERFKGLRNKCKFIHLHVHDEYSILDGYGTCESRILKAKMLGMPAIAITNHGNMAGALRFYKECKKQGLNPIIGQEFYICKDLNRKGLTEKEREIIHTDYKAGERREVTKNYLKKVGATDNRHIILIAKNQIGYNNLLKLSSMAFIDGFYRSPRIDFSVLFKYKKGLIILTACMNNIFRDLKFERAVKRAKLFKKHFKDDFYIEVQLNNMKEQIEVNDFNIKLAKKCDVKLILTNDVHYNEKEEWKLHDKFIKIRDKERDSYGTNDLYMKGEKDIESSFIRNYKGRSKYKWGIYKCAMENTMEVHRKCYVEIDTGRYSLPEYKIVQAKGYRKGMTKREYFEWRILKGWKIKLSKLKKEKIKVYKNRLDMELDVILGAGYLDYFLIILDIMDYAKDNKMLCWARGSAAGSLISYLLDITAPDPIRFKLLFERFLSQTRTKGSGMVYDCNFDGYSKYKYNRLQHIKETK